MLFRVGSYGLPPGWRFVDRVQRRIAAILAADVVGYSRLTGNHEEATLATLKALREIIDGLIGKYAGPCLSPFRSDDSLAEFGF